MAWFHLVMSTITDPVLPLPLHFFLGFSGPGILITGSTLVMAMWHSQLGSILVLAACALLTWMIAPDCISDFIRPMRPLEAPRSYLVLAILLSFVILAAAAAKRGRK
jgi:hypothetical protein